jgi:hypothetical protein
MLNADVLVSVTENDGLRITQGSITIELGPRQTQDLRWYLNSPHYSTELND